MVRYLLDKCCFCIDLRSGCLIIGYIELVVNLFFLAGTLVLLLGGGMMAVMGATEADSDVVAVGLMDMVVAGAAVLLCSLLLCFTVTLLVGLHNSQRRLVLAYLMFAAVFVALTVVFFLLSFSGPVNVHFIIRDGFNIAWGIYSILVIRSYYYKMEDASPAEACSAAA